MLLENNPYPADVRVRREAESLAAAGHAVTVNAPRAAGQAVAESIAGVRVRRFPLPEGSGAAGFAAEYGAAAVWLHRAAMRDLRGGATALHLHNPPDILFPAGVIARAAGRRVVFDHHDLFPELVSVRFGARPLVTAARLCERLTFAAADLVLAANESHADVARRRGGKRERSVVVVRNGPLASQLAAPEVRVGALADPRLVYVGSVAAQDGVEALPELLALVPGATLTIVGDGEARPRVEAAAARAGVADRLEFTGWVELERVPQLIAAADICVDPAPPTELNHHSTMIKIAEYLAAAKPVAAYDLVETARTVGGAVPLAKPGDIADLAAHVARLAGDERERRRAATAGRERAEALTWEHSERALLDAYGRLAPGRPAGRHWE